jgi:hypothetical protein
MAEKKISELSTASDPTGTVYVEVVQGGVTKKVTNTNFTNGINTSAAKYTGTDTTDDGTGYASAFLINRALENGVVDANAHGFRDRTVFQRNTRAYAPFDAQVTYNGGHTFDHNASFQARPFVDGNSTVINDYGVFSKPEITAGSTITNGYGVKIEDYTGSGAMTNQYGLYIDDLTKGGTSWAIYCNGATPSIHKGNFGIGDLATFPSSKLEVINTSGLNFSFERQNAATNVPVTVGQVKAKSTGNMADGFGSLLAFSIQDDVSGTAEIGYIGALRSGADTTGDLVFYTVTAGVASKRLTITKDGHIIPASLPTSSAGLTAGTLWNDSGTVKVA